MADLDPPLDYPVVLTVAGRRCLVVGAGPVATRRARGLLDAGADVVVVAPRISDAMERLSASMTSREPTAGSLTVQRRRYRRGEAAAYALVVTATGVHDVDAAVVTDASTASVPVTSASRGTPGTVRLPAIHREGPVTVAVSTGGVSPTLARWLRDRIVTALPADLATVTRLVAETSPTREAVGNARADAPDLLDRVMVLVAEGRTEEARALLARPDGSPPPE